MPLSRILPGFATLLVFLAGGKWLALALGLPIPGSVIGMSLLVCDPKPYEIWVVWERKTG